MPIIVEGCQNHQGSIDILKDMVYRAADAGATYFKIQSFFADDLGPDWQFDYDRIKSLELSWSDHKEFVKVCKQSKITPMTSVYSLKYLDELWKCGFKHIKIGSAQATDERLITGYIAKGFQVVLSTGGHRLHEIPKIIPLHAVLHCVSKYPLAPEESDLVRMLQLRKYWTEGTAIGFSDHTDPMHEHWDLAAKVAMYLGATFVERHFTILPRNQTKDGPVSINTDQLKELVRWDRLTQEERLKEKPHLGLLVNPKALQEYDLVKRYKSRWIA